MRAPGPASGPGERPRERGGEEGRGRLGPNQPVSLPSLRLTGSGEGRGGATPGPATRPSNLLVGGGAEERGSSATAARAGEGRRKSGPRPATADSRPPPPPSPRKQPPAQLRTLAVPTGAAARSPLPRPAVRPRGGPQSARGPRPGVVKIQPFPRRPPCVATTPGRRRRRGGGGGGVLLSRPLPSPPLNSHPTSGRDGVKRRRRWYFRVARLGAECGRGRSPKPGGTWRTPDSPAGRRPPCIGRFRRPGEDDRREPQPRRPDSCCPRAWRPPRTPRGPGAQDPRRPGPDCSGGPAEPPRCPVSLRRRRGPVSGGSDGRDLTREEAAPAPRSAASSRRCRAARTRRWGEAGA